VRNKECQDKINQGMRKMLINGNLYALLWCSYFEEQFGDIERNEGESTWKKRFWGAKI